MKLNLQEIADVIDAETNIVEAQWNDIRIQCREAKLKGDDETPKILSPIRVDLERRMDELFMMRNKISCNEFNT